MGNQDCSTYQFSDISPYGNMMQEGDWVLIKTQGQGYLWKVSSLNVSRSTHEPWKLRLVIPSNAEEVQNSYESVFKNKEGESIKAIFYKDLSPTQYYLSMLGIYIYHLFFVSLDGNTHDKPALENALRSFGIKLIEKIRINPSKVGQEAPVSVNNVKTQKKEGGVFGFGKRKQKPMPQVSVPSGPSPKEILLKDIISTLTLMYLKLVFVDSRDSYFSEKESLEEMLIAVRSSMHTLKAQVAEFIGCEVVQLDQMSPKLAKQLPQLSSQFGVSPGSVSFAFNELMSQLIHIPSHAEEQGYLKNIFSNTSK